MGLSAVAVRAFVSSSYWHKSSPHGPLRPGPINSFLFQAPSPTEKLLFSSSFPGLVTNKMTADQLQENPTSTTAEAPDRFVDNPLVAGMVEVLSRIHSFKQLARDYYFEALLSAHPCPECGGRLQMSGQSQCSCSCGASLDPTIEFQRSPCCGARLVRRVLHYACRKCGRTVVSRFLFDERLFDQAYFREMMAESRARARQKKEEVRRLLAESRSGAMVLLEEPAPAVLPSLFADLDSFLEFNRSMAAEALATSPAFRLDQYRGHLRSVLSRDSKLFSDIAPLNDNSRLDQVWRFITLIFMAHDREVFLTQYGHDLLIERCLNEADQ